MGGRPKVSIKLSTTPCHVELQVSHFFRAWIPHQPLRLVGLVPVEAKVIPVGLFVVFLLKTCCCEGKRTWAFIIFLESGGSGHF